MENNNSNGNTSAATVSRFACRKLADGRFIEAEAKVVREKELSIYVDGEYLVTASITPGMEKEFVTGYLFGQGFIEGVGEIASTDIDGDTASVRMRDNRKIMERAVRADYRIVSGGGRAVFLGEMTFPALNRNIKVDKRAIFGAMNTIFNEAVLYRETEGVHASGLFTPEGKTVCLVEDIGRHNCLDKTIGYALLNDIDCAGVFLASTGRMASEMVTKICRARIPVVATKTAITGAALALARRCGLTLIGFVRDSGNRINTDMSVRVIMEAGMKIYTDAERVIGKETVR
jgi:FdhD protein